MKKRKQSKNKGYDIKVIPIDDVYDLEMIEELQIQFVNHKKQLMERIECIKNKNMDNF